MTELVTTWLLIVLALALLALICYIARDASKERRWSKRQQKIKQEYMETLRRRIEDNRDDVARGLGRR